MVGAVLLKAMPGDAGAETPDIELGWYVVRSRWGEGFVPEAAWAVAEYALDELGLPEIHAIVKPGNDRSMGVAQRSEWSRSGGRRNITTAWKQSLSL